MSRAARIGRALTIGYGFQATVALTGLALTPLLLSRLGADDYGRWLIAGQVLALLALLDLGVTAVLPREVARAAGAGEPVADVVRRARWLVWLQTPVVAAAAAGTWVAMSAARPELGGPLAVVLIGFTVQFPLRIPGAVLGGLQDLTFCAALTAAQWAVTTVVSVALVLSGWGLLALAVGWAVGQAVGCAVAWMRLRAAFPDARSRWNWPGRASLVAFLRPSCWTSARQIAQALVHGIDLIVLGWVAGPAAVVVYSCTVKLIGFLNNQPFMLGTLANPALSELRAGGDTERLLRAASALGLATLLMSGGLGVVVLAVNAAFVTLWVGPNQFGGPTLTVLAVLGMVGRHWVFTWYQPAFALGYDRRLALATFADGLVTAVAMVGWTTALGVIGVPLGAITGLLLTDGPVGLIALAEGVNSTPARVLRWATPWATRFVAIAGPLAAVGYLKPWAADPWVAAGLLAVGLVGYAVATLPLLTREPLGPYTAGPLAALYRRLRLMRPAERATTGRSSPPNESS